MLKRSCLFLCLLALVFASCRSVPKNTRVYEFGLHKIFTDHMVFQRQKQRRALALKLGADFAFDPREPDFIQKVKDATDGKVAMFRNAASRSSMPAGSLNT